MTEQNPPALFRMPAPNSVGQQRSLGLLQGIFQSNQFEKLPALNSPACRLSRFCKSHSGFWSSTNSKSLPVQIAVERYVLLPLTLGKTATNSDCQPVSFNRKRSTCRRLPRLVIMPTSPIRITLGLSLPPCRTVLEVTSIEQSPLQFLCTPATAICRVFRSNRHSINFLKQFDGASL